MTKKIEIQTEDVQKLSSIVSRIDYIEQHGMNQGVDATFYEVGVTKNIYLSPNSKILIHKKDEPTPPVTMILLKPSVYGEGYYYDSRYEDYSVSTNASFIYSLTTNNDVYLMYSFPEDKILEYNIPKDIPFKIQKGESIDDCTFGAIESGSGKYYIPIMPSSVRYIVRYCNDVGKIPNLDFSYARTNVLGNGTYGSFGGTTSCLMFLSPSQYQYYTTNKEILSQESSIVITGSNTGYLRENPNVLVQVKIN